MPGRPDARLAAPPPVLPAAADDHVAISDALMRFAAGVDWNEADLIRDGGLWRMRRMVIAGAWSEGEAGVLVSR